MPIDANEKETGRFQSENPIINPSELRSIFDEDEKPKYDYIENLK